MDKLKMQTVNKVNENVERIAALFPNCVTESIGADGKPTRVVDFDLLRQELSGFAVEGQEERYQFTWADKKKSILLANSPISKTLRPCREESVNFDMTKNLYIEGDNLDVLKLLQETYMGKVKMIYIDPPYNTRGDLIYGDDFATSAADYFERSGAEDEEGNRLFQNNDSNGRFHTDWLNMIYPRLKLARDLLTDDGVIFISIDDNEQANLKKICDEIFGAGNFVGMVSRATGTTTGQDADKIGASLDYLMVYSKSAEFALTGIDLTEDDEARFSFEDKRGKYSLLQMRKTGNADRRVDRPSMYYPVTAPNKKEIYPIGPTGYESRWRFGQETYKEYLSKDMIVWQTSRSGEIAPYVKYYLEGRTKAVSNLWTNIDGNKKGSIEVRDLFGEKVFDYPKPTEFLRRIITIAGATNNSLILDFFSGSAATAHAVIQLNAEDGGNRKFIMVQLPEETAIESEAYKAGYKNICEIGKERIRRAGLKILQPLVTGAGRADGTGFGMGMPTSKTEWDIITKEVLDIGFRVLKVDSSNMKPVFYNPNVVEQSLISQFEDNIKDDRTPEDLLFQVMLDMGVDLSSTITVETLGGKKVFTVGGDNLICCFDKDITKDAVTEIAKRKPLYSVFRDSSFARDDVMVSFDQIFETYSPTTTRRVI